MGCPDGSRVALGMAGTGRGRPERPSGLSPDLFDVLADIELGARVGVGP